MTINQLNFFPTHPGHIFSTQSPSNKKITRSGLYAKWLRLCWLGHLNDDLSKYFYFAVEGNKLDLTLVISYKRNEKFIEDLQRRGVGPSSGSLPVNTK